MKLSDIQYELIMRAKNASGLLPIAYPHESFERPANGAPYTEMQVVPNDTVDAWCGTLKTGNVIFRLMYSQESKLIPPTVEAEKFLAVFAEGDVFNGVRIPDEGTIRDAVKDGADDGRYFIPVIIKFSAR